MLIPPLEEQDVNNIEQYSRWDFVANQVSYTPLHWLAFWNDAESIHYILNLIPQNITSYKKLMHKNVSGLTPLDIAGQHGCHEAAMLIINFLTARFEYICEIFDENKKQSKN